MRIRYINVFSSSLKLKSKRLNLDEHCQSIFRFQDNLEMRLVYSVYIYLCSSHLDISLCWLFFQLFISLKPKYQTSTVHLLYKQHIFVWKFMILFQYKMYNLFYIQWIFYGVPLDVNIEPPNEVECNAILLVFSFCSVFSPHRIFVAYVQAVFTSNWEV